MNKTISEWRRKQTFSSSKLVKCRVVEERKLLFEIRVSFAWINMS